VSEGGRTPYCLKTHVHDDFFSVLGSRERDGCRYQPRGKIEEVFFYILARLIPHRGSSLYKGLAINYPI
jgi:hypothetical protein